MRIKDNRIESLEVLDWLKMMYGDKLNADLISVKLFQDNVDVWLEIIRSFKNEIGKKTIKEVINLDFIAEPYENPLDIAPEGESLYDTPVYRPEHDIEKNARMLFEDEITLENVTPLFD